MLIWRLAFRNLFRHKSRLALNLILLIGAFCAIVIFKGFKFYVLSMTKDLMVDTQYGHIQIAKNSFWTRAPVDRETDRMLDNPSSLMESIRKLPNIQSVSSRLSFYGLLNTETQSLPTRFIGIEPGVETKAQEQLLFTEGKPFHDRRQLIISSGLQNILKVHIGSEVTVVSPTLDGSLNAVDMQVTGVFKTGLSEFDKASAFLSVQDAQKIISTDQVDTLILLLKNPDLIASTTQDVEGLLPNSDLKIKKWTELAELYTQVENYYNFQALFVEFILLLLLLLSISNTVSMTVFERLGEIGTLRALGDQERDIQLLILSECIALSALALALALPISYGLTSILSNLDVPLTLPLSSRPIPLKIIPHLEAFIEASGVCFLSVVLASLWPARKATQISIVSALRAKM